MRAAMWGVVARGIRCTGGPGTSDPGTLTCGNYSLSFLVMMAYNLRSFQLTAPAWMDTARYNFVAKIPSGTDPRQFGLMQQKLLAERFGLQVHFEKQDSTVYELTVARGGLKLKESQEPAAEKPKAAWKPPAGGPPRRTRAYVKRKGESIANLANFLSNQLGQPVTDATGLGGRYDYELSFLMEPGGRAAGPALNGSEPEFGVTLIEAVRDQWTQAGEEKRARRRARGGPRREGPDREPTPVRRRTSKRAAWCADRRLWCLRRRFPLR
jgi:uncharacterized protein (TIGR03435 family)